MDGRVRGIGRLALLAVGLVALIGLSGCDVTGTLHGRLVDQATGTVASGVVVTAYADASETVVAQTVTNANGGYLFTSDALPPGRYRLQFDESVWWGGSSWASATPVDLSGGPARVDATIAVDTASISGHLSRADGEACCEYEVILENVLGGPEIRRPAAETYSAEGIPAGTYRIRFQRSDPSVYRQTVYLGQANTAAEAPTFHLAPGSSTPDLDAEFPRSWETSAFYVSEGGDATPDVEDLMVVVDAENLNPVALAPKHMSGFHQGEGIPYTPVRIALLSKTGRLAPMFIGATASNPLGTVFRPGDPIPMNIEMRGRDCDPAVFTPGADHHGQDLSGRFLINCDLSGSDLSGSSLSGADLRYADLTGANLRNADLSGVENWWAAEGTGTATYDNTTCPTGAVVTSPAVCPRY